MVTEEGERILSDYDNWAIPTLRRHHLVWSGWGPMQVLDDTTTILGTHWGHRNIEGDGIEEWSRLRMFLLSILWRAAVTNRTEFSEIFLPKDHEEQLRQMVFEGNPALPTFYAISLIQLSTLGVRHNHSAFAATKQIPAIGKVPSRQEPFFRFFMDGLIIHFSRLSVEEQTPLNLNRILVGGSEQLSVTTVKYEESAQRQNLAIVMLESELGRPLYELQQGPFS